MGKRNYYIISHHVEYDGYNYYIDYIGCNQKAAADRFFFFCEEIKNQYFLEENIAPDRINESYPDNIILERELRPYETVNCYMNDDEECWINITLQCMPMGGFADIGRTDAHNRERENRYKNRYPNSKY